jgi:Helicase HerA, central domain
VTIAIILVVIGLIAASAGGFFVVTSRRNAQSVKNIERGLKMMPLMIHLPPSSDDIDGGGRDVRDIVDENVSKAQIIYNIIASTWQKDKNFKKFGQRHLGFEVVAMNGFVYFYAIVPVLLIEVVKQAIVSAYPSARLEEAPDHNVFSDVGKINGVAGGELVLKEPYGYPIATYQDIKRDPMQALLNAMGGLEKQDGATVQILFRPADPSWRKTANELADKKKKGKDKKGGFASNAGAFGKDLVTALSKPPEGGESGKSDSKDLSSLDQSVVDAIHDKTRTPGFEVVIRLVVSSNINQRAQALLNNIVASFSLYDAPGKNGFKFEATKDVHGLVSDYLLRLFPQRNKETVLNSIELATLFHFPDQKSTPTSQLERQDSKQVDGPRNMPDDGLLLGYNVFRGVKKPVHLALQDRQRHMYVVGQTGTGKSTFLENLALQDMLNGGGFAFVDPHGDTAEKLLSMVPKERTEDVIYFSPSDSDFPMGLNIFEFKTPEQKDFLIQEAINMLYKLYDPQHQGIMGPRYEHLFRNAALAVMADPNGGTFIDIPKLFRDPQYVKQKLQHVTDLNVREFWEKEMPASQRSNEFGEVTSWFVSKFGAFLGNEMMRNIIGQTKSSFDLREVMDEGKILIVNLSKGRLGDLNAKLLGIVFVMKFQAAAMSRADIPESERKDFSLYVDEFQNFSTDSFATIMSEARKYHLNLIVANQFTTQLTDEIRDAVFGNMGSVVSFRIGQNDVDSLSRYFQPAFDGDDLLRVPNYNTILRTLIHGVPTQPFSMATLPPLGTPNDRLASALKQLSAAKYGRPKAQVEKEIFGRLKTIEQPKPAFGSSRPTFGTPSTTQAAARPSMPSVPSGAAPGKSGSFLDDWMAKRQSGTQGGYRPTPSGANFHTNPQAGVQETQTSLQHVAPSKRPAAPAKSEKPADQPKNEQEKPQQKTLEDADTILIDNDGNLKQVEETS